MSTLKVNSIEPTNAGSEDYFLNRAWVNFNGTGTVAIRGDGNVSSITDNGTGFYTVNYASSLSDTGYSVAGICNQLGNTADNSGVTIAGINGAVVSYSTAGTSIRTAWPNVGVRDGEYVSFKATR